MNQYLPFAIIAVLALMVIGCAVNNLVQGQSQQDQCIKGSFTKDSDAYNNTVRTQELKEYIVENANDLLNPFVNANDTKDLCKIANNIVSMEMSSPESFDNETLDILIKSEAQGIADNELSIIMEEGVS